MSTTLVKLEYAQTTPPALPSEFDVELDRARGKWLRRRFLWFCALWIVLSVAIDSHAILGVLSAPRALRMELRISGAATLITIGAYFAAAAYAWRTSHRERLIRLAFWLNAILGAINIAAARLTMSFNPDLAAMGVSAATLFALTIPLVSTFYHFTACLLIPWTFRESLEAASGSLGAYGLILLVDALRGAFSPWVLLMLVLLPLPALPGAAVCWWRFSRFRRQFRLVFESDRYRKLQSELAGARQIHDSCLPTPRLSGAVRLAYAYEPMRQIGGDLLFLHSPPGEPELINAVLLDVTGHGIAAALTVNRLFGELERIFAEAPLAAPDQVLCALNRYIHLTLSRHTVYATALCIQARPDGKLGLSGGGHPPAFVRRADGGVESLDSDAVMLGVVPPGDFECAPASVELGAGDVLVAYTDGASEMIDATTGKQVGIGGVRDLFSQLGRRHGAAELPGRMFDALLGRRRAPAQDDTLIFALWRAA